MTTVQPSQRTQYICPLSPAISTLPAITHYTTSAGLRPPRTIAATGGLSPPDAPYQERPGGRNIQDYVICVSYCFFSVMSFVLFDICRTENHKPRGRASGVSAISTCVSIYANDLLPTPPPNLCESGLGVSLLCTCVAFSLLLN
jgi:hypothetical protein